MSEAERSRSLKSKIDVTHTEVHNLYGLMMAKACYQGLQRHRG
ncbi:MAG: TIM-barrel domain-containing protein, partial [Nostoc sp.]